MLSQHGMQVSMLLESRVSQMETTFLPPQVRCSDTNNIQDPHENKSYTADNNNNYVQNMSSIRAAGSPWPG
ncbi:hypothetical protein H5410_007434 [Solanum commersonii]|uniref:Uncharacterized protein n=1 Tax=Solanum commersonii TaxID=4109 RepID=A0A9J6ACG3_SOLCO|nr:hypothetical protein H5410_007434 [Solanum commersonii]